jgi:hypothetical protein
LRILREELHAQERAAGHTPRFSGRASLHSGRLPGLRSAEGPSQRRNAR